MDKPQSDLVLYIDYDPNEQALAETPPEVILLLGFDPREFLDDEGETPDE